MSARRRGKKPTPGVGFGRADSAETDSRSRFSAWLVALALVILTIAVYAQVSSHTFVSLDDGDYVTQNSHVTGGLTIENVRWALTSGHAANWHPLTWMSLQADVSAFGAGAGPMHLANVAWHVLDALLLFGLLRAMTGSVWRSGFVAALFALHPAHVESVAWIAERKDVLSAAFWFGTTWAYVRWVRQPAAWRYAAMLVLFALGLMAKPMLVTLPATLLLLDAWPLDRASVALSKRVIEKLPLFALAIASSVVTMLAQHAAMSSLDLVPLPIRLSNAVLSYGRYLVTIFWPADLSLLYPLQAPVPMDRVIASAAAIAVISFLAWRTRRTLPFVLTGWLWFLGTLVPVIGIVQVGMQALADRYTYIPSVGIFIAVVWTVSALASRARMPAAVVAAAGAVIVAILTVATYAQTSTWATNETLWRQAVDATTNNPRAHIELGVVYGKQSRHAEAEAEFRQALQMKLGGPDARDLFPNLAGALMAQNKVAEAIPQLVQAIELGPTRVDLRHQLALAYARTGRPDEALASWREAVRINPAFEDAYLGMGVLLAGQGKIDEARRALTELLRINPNRKDAQQALARMQGK